MMSFETFVGLEIEEFEKERTLQLPSPTVHYSAESLGVQLFTINTYN